VPNHPGKMNQDGIAFLKMKADGLKQVNGTVDNMGMRSQGDQQLDQRTLVNLESGNQQKVAESQNFLKTFSTRLRNIFDSGFDRIFPDNTVDHKTEDGRIIKVNKDLKKRLDNDEELKRQLENEGTIPGMEKPTETPQYNIDGGIMDPNDPRTYPSGLGTGP
tara:strand:+ start:229 stop:714 length:486 start_codon:yes stop_codon:yes gene_type:complete